MTGHGARPGIDLGFGHELAALKDARGISFEHLAQQTGYARTYLQDICAGRRGHTWPAQELVDRVAAAFDVEPDHFTITRARAVLEEPTVLDVAYGKVKSVRKLRAKTTGKAA